MFSSVDDACIYFILYSILHLFRNKYVYVCLCVCVCVCVCVCKVKCFTSMAWSCLPQCLIIPVWVFLFLWFFSSTYRLWLQCARLHEAPQSDLTAEEVDQDPGGEDQTAAQVLPYWGEMPLPQQFLCTNCWSGDPWWIPDAQTYTLLHQDCQVMASPTQKHLTCKDQLWNLCHL